MSRVPELLAAVEALPAQTKACEHLVHTLGWEPDAVANRLGIPLAQVRTHLQAARDARHALALERERCPIVHHEDCTWGTVVEARQGRDEAILEMVGQGMRPHQAAVRLGVTVDVVYHVMTANRRRRLAEARLHRVGKRVGVDERAIVDKKSA